MNRRDFVKMVGCATAVLALPGCNSVSGLPVGSPQGALRRGNIISGTIPDLGRCIPGKRHSGGVSCHSFAAGGVS